MDYTSTELFLEFSVEVCLCLIHTLMANKGSPMRLWTEPIMSP